MLVTYIHCVPIEVTPKLKSTQIKHNSTEPYVILTKLITIYLTSTAQISTKYTTQFLEYIKV